MLVTRLHGGGCAAQTAALAHAPRRARVACHWKGKNKGTPSSKHNVTNRSKRLAVEHTMALEQERVARGEDPEAQAPQLALVLDGANLAWAYADAVARHTGYRGRIGPLSRGIDLAMQHEALQGCAPRVFLPRHYVIGKQHELVDGWSVPRECIPDHTSIKRVSKMSKRATVRNEKVYAMVQEGNAVLVTRNTSTPGGRNRDDVELLVEAKRTGGLVCTNDQFRDHKRTRAVGFRQPSHFKDWLRRNRFEFEFRVTGDIDEEALRTQEAARDPLPLEGEEKWTIVGEDGDDKDHLGRPKRGLDPRHPLLWADRLEVTFVPKFTPPIANRLGLVEEEGVGQEGAEAISA